MKKMCLAVLAGMVCVSEFVISGGDIDVKTELEVASPYKYVKKPITADNGDFHGYVRMHHVFAGDDNGFDPLTGSTLGFGLGYGLEVISGFRVGAELYGAMDSGLTDTDETAIAYGQFMNEVKNPNELDPGIAWGIHMRYKMEGVFTATLGRTQFKSPMTKIQITHVPNMYEFARVDKEVLGGEASIAYISKMAYGSRSTADYGLIGESTGTAGMYLAPLTTIVGGSPEITRGKYYSIEDTLKSNDSNGIFLLGYEKKIDNFNLRVWDFYVDDVANNIYVDGTYTFPLGEEKGVKLSAQIWNQSISNDFYKDAYGGTLLGMEAVLRWGQLIGTFAYNTKDDGGLLNAWGTNPGYTSSIFSRNQYRSEVNAYKATLEYNPLKNLKFLLSYVDYGQSTTLGKTSITDARERDIAIIYKPLPQISLKLFNADRTSEYSVEGSKTQNHTRLIMNYAF